MPGRAVPGGGGGRKRGCATEDMVHLCVVPTCRSPCASHNGNNLEIASCLPIRCVLSNACDACNQNTKGPCLCMLFGAQSALFLH